MISLHTMCKLQTIQAFLSPQQAWNHEWNVKGSHCLLWKEARMRTENHLVTVFCSCNCLLPAACLEITRWCVCLPGAPSSTVFPSTTLPFKRWTRWWAGWDTRDCTETNIWISKRWWQSRGKLEGKESQRKASCSRLYWMHVSQYTDGLNSALCEYGRWMYVRTYYMGRSVYHDIVEARSVVVLDRCRYW